MFFTKKEKKYATIKAVRQTKFVRKSEGCFFFKYWTADFVLICRLDNFCIEILVFVRIFDSFQQFSWIHFGVYIWSVTVALSLSWNIRTSDAKSSKAKKRCCVDCSIFLLCLFISLSFSLLVIFGKIASNSEVSAWGLCIFPHREKTSPKKKYEFIRSEQMNEKKTFVHNNYRV